MTNPAGYLPKVDDSPPIPQLRFTDPVKFEKDVSDFFDSITIREPIKEEKITEDGKIVEIPTEQYQIKWLKPPSMVALGNYLDCDYRLFKQMLDDKYEGHPQWTKELSTSLKRTVARARQICHEYAYGSLYTSKSAQGPIFALKTVYKDHGYQEEININQNTTVDDKRISLSSLNTDDLEMLVQLMEKAVGKAIEHKESKLLQNRASDADYEDVPTS